jgi:hypothetical protein
MFARQEGSTDLLLSQVIGQVSDHDLGGGGNAVLGRTTLLGRTRSSSLSGLLSSSLGSLVGDIGKGSGLSSTGTTSTSATSATTATTATTTASTTILVTSLSGDRGLLLVVLGLASELDANLALEDVLAGEVLDSLGGLVGGLQVDEGIPDGTVGTRVDRDGSALAVIMIS